MWFSVKGQMEIRWGGHARRRYPIQRVSHLHSNQTYRKAAIEPFLNRYASCCLGEAAAAVGSDVMSAIVHSYRRTDRHVLNSPLFARRGETPWKLLPHSA
ncbi:uncharacterized protein ACO6RY_03194 [Pungitius sinensis]